MAEITVTTPTTDSSSSTGNDVNLQGYYTKQQIDSSLLDYEKKSELNTTLQDYVKTSDLNGYVKQTDIPTKTSQLTNDSDFVKTEDLSSYAKVSDIPTNYLTQEVEPLWTSDKPNYSTKNELSNEVAILNNNLDKKQDHLTAGENITISEDNVISSTGGGGSVSGASDIVKDITQEDYNNLTEYEDKLYNITDASSVSVPTKTSQLTNDSGYLTSYTETDPIWESEKGSYYTKSEVDQKISSIDLSSYVTTSDLNTTLSDYVKNSEELELVLADLQTSEILDEGQDYNTINTTIENILS